MKITCPICGRIDDTEEYINSPIRKIMEEKKCCFHCAFWYNINEVDKDPYDLSIPVVVNHSHWSYHLSNPIRFEQSHGWSYKPIPTMHYILFENGIPVSNEPGHGIGVQSICAIVERYGGMCTFLVQNHHFILRLSL